MTDNHHEPHPYRVTVAPGSWVVVLDDQNYDRTLAVFHTNDRNITFLVDPHELTVDFDTASGDYPEEGWRVRAYPNETPDSERGIGTEVPPPVPEDLVTGHPLVQTRHDALARTEAALAAAVDQGLLREVDPRLGGARFELTEAGKRHSEQQLGLPEGTLG
jgi:hypothetical protein